VPDDDITNPRVKDRLRERGLRIDALQHEAGQLRARLSQWRWWAHTRLSGCPCCPARGEDAELRARLSALLPEPTPEGCDL